MGWDSGGGGGDGMGKSQREEQNSKLSVEPDAGFDLTNLGS